MRRETQNILLVLLGGALLKISFTGTYLRYVKSGHLWLLITAGTVMLLLAAVSIWRDVRAARVATEPGDVDQTAEPGEHGTPDTHEHQHSGRSTWLLLLPVLAVFLIAPPALGSDSVRSSAGSAPPAEDSSAEDGSALFPPLPDGEVIALPLSEFATRAAWDSGDSLNDREVRLTGFVLREGRDTYVARFAIRCCAADAYPIKVRLEGAELSEVSELAQDRWIEAVVVLRPGSATRENHHVPSATVTSVRRVPEPKDPYEH